jgi:hypothetical protein
MVTDRMLGMFSRKPKPKVEENTTVTPAESGGEAGQ